MSMSELRSTIDALRKLKRKAISHNDFNGGMRLGSGQVLTLVDAALALLNLQDSNVAKTQILETFRGELPDQL